jgi:threonine dehydrogenase-like Zn-dependent dehydrogenase
VQGLCKAGTLSIIGVYPPTAEHFPIGAAMGKSLTVNMGNCNHRRYLPELVRMVKEGNVDPEKVLTQREPVLSALEAYKEFDRRRAGWIKLELVPDQSENPTREPAQASHAKT